MELILKQSKKELFVKWIGIVAIVIITLSAVLGILKILGVS